MYMAPSGGSPDKGTWKKKTLLLPALPDSPGSYPAVAKFLHCYQNQHL